MAPLEGPGEKLAAISRRLGGVRRAEVCEIGVVKNDWRHNFASSGSQATGRKRVRVEPTKNCLATHRRRTIGSSWKPTILANVDLGQRYIAVPPSTL